LVGVHRDRAGPKFIGRTKRPDGNFSAVGHENLREHPAPFGTEQRCTSHRTPGIGAHAFDRVDAFRLLKVEFRVVHVLSVSSLKGGVGKTTVTLGLASAAFAKGLRTLVVDLDPQSDVSTGTDINVSGHLNVADVLASPKEKIVRAAIAPSGWTKGRPGKIDVMIGSPSAINFDGPHPSIRDIWKLEEALANV